MAYKEGVTIITCTGGRPKCFKLLDYFVSRQDWTGPVQWLIVDDVDSPLSPNTTIGRGSLEITGEPKDGNWAWLDVTRVSPEPKWSHGQNTLARNILAAIPHVMYDKVLFFEDDDWYSPTYVTNMITPISECGLAGDPLSLYYHVPSRQYRRMVNAEHASLCQTGIRSDLLPVLEQVCRQSLDFIDLNLWTAKLPPGTRGAFTLYGGVVGMKGLPGRPGIGVGHQPQRSPELWQHDADLAVLRGWIGIDDVELYREFM